MLDNKQHLFDCETCMFRTVSCMYLTKDEFEIIRRTSLQLRFKKGETIFKQGAKSSHLLFLHKGIVKFNIENESGKNYIITIVAGPKLLGGANLFFRDTNLFSFIAVEDSEVCFIDNRAIRSVLLKHSNFMWVTFEKVVEMFQASIFNFISIAHKQVNGRIADVLIYLSQNVYKNTGYEFTLSRKEISEFAACSHENVITTLSKFNKEGIISLEGKKIIINDLSKLKEISKHG